LRIPGVLSSARFSRLVRTSWLKLVDHPCQVVDRLCRVLSRTFQLLGLLVKAA
jgi:hypothetical protein